MKKMCMSYKIVSIFLVCMLLAMSVGKVHAGPPPFPFFHDPEHTQESERQESLNAFIQLEKRMSCVFSKWKRHGHDNRPHNVEKPTHRTSGPSENTETRRDLRRMFSILNFQFQQLVPTPRCHIPLQLTPSGVASTPGEPATPHQQPIVCTATSDDVVVAANHHLHQFQILLI